MRAINKLAKANLGLLESLAHVSTEKVSVAFLKNRVPEMVGMGRVNLPTCLLDSDMIDQLGRTWRHELQHARDVLDGVDLPLEQMEKRARMAERLVQEIEGRSVDV
jgi:hypothetical protein